MRWLFLVLALTACDSKDADTAVEVCTSDTPMTWENFGQGFFATYCLGCHSAEVTGAYRFDAPVGVDFDDLESMKPFWNATWVQVASGHPVGIVEGDIDLFRQFIFCSPEAP